MEQNHIEQVVIDPCAVHKRLWKVTDWHCVIVYSKNLIDMKLFLLNLLLRPRFSTKCSQFKLSIIYESTSKLVTCRVLLHIFGLDIAIFFATYFLFKGHSIGFQGVLLDVIFTICCFGHRQHRFGVVGDNARYYWVHGHNVLGFSQTCE